jgi:uncharacterized cupin superfamily protein
MFSITQYGKELDKSKYSWNEKTKTLTTKENDLVLDFSDYFGVTFKTGDSCTFKTGSSCAFDTGSNCTFNTGSSCTFNTGSNCTFKTGYVCTFTTSHSCTFDTGSDCTFNTGDFCTFYTGYSCTFKTGGNCVVIRFDVNGITEIPKYITIKFNDNGISGYTKVEEDKPKPSNPCNGKVVEIDGKKYKLQEIS